MQVLGIPVSPEVIGQSLVRVQLCIVKDKKTGHFIWHTISYNPTGKRNLELYFDSFRETLFSYLVILLKLFLNIECLFFKVDLISHILLKFLFLNFPVTWIFK